MFNFKSTRGYLTPDQIRALNSDPELWYPTRPDYYRYAFSEQQVDGLLFSVERQRELAELDAAMTRGGFTIVEKPTLTNSRACRDGPRSPRSVREFAPLPLPLQASLAASETARERQRGI
jgi:hypothetical protein